MNLHLLSTPGENDIRYIVEACRPYLKDKINPTVAFMPLASHANDWMDYTTRQFDGLGKIERINTDSMSLDEMKEIISQASVTYISGGNTFLLNHRLHTSGLMSYLRESILNGLPLVGFSAGAILCGANILTSEDMNMIETNHFAGLNLSPFNYFVHYPEDDSKREYADGWLEWYHVYHENPVIIMADGAYIKVDDNETTLIQGDAWILRKGSQKEKLAVGKIISA
jgi:dipeptidase E